MERLDLIGAAADAANVSGLETARLETAVDLAGFLLVRVSCLRFALIMATAALPPGTAADLVNMTLATDSDADERATAFLVKHARPLDSSR